MTRPFCVIGFSMLFTLFAASITDNKQAISAAIFVVLIAFVLSLCIRKTRQNRTLPTALAAAACALILLVCADARLEKQRASFFETEQGEIQISASLADLPYNENGRYYAVLRVHSVNGKPVHCKLRLVSNTPQDFSAHDTLYLTVKPFLLGKNGENTAVAAYYRAKGIVCGAYASGELHTAAQTQTDLFSYILTFRAALCRKIFESVSGDAGGVLAAMSMGFRGALSNRVKNDFRAAGISHLLAVSGLHLTTWTLVLSAVLRAFHIRRKARAAVSLGFVLFFAVLTGGAPSVWRAAIMAGTVFAADLFRREAESLNSIGLALFCMLTVNPFAARDLSLLLSVFAAAGILLFSEKAETAFARKIRPIQNDRLRAVLQAAFSVIAVTVCASVFTLPVQMWAFGTVSVVCVPANFLCLTVGSAAMVFGTLGALTVLLQLPALGKILFFLAENAAKWVLLVTAWFAKNCNALLPVDSNYAKILLAFLFIGCAVMLCLRAPKKRLLRAGAVGAAILFLICNFTVYFVRESRLQLTACNVGNGTAVILRTEGQTVLLCSGGNLFAESEICAILSLYGVTHLDALFLPCQSEADAETGFSVARQFPVGTVYYSETLKSETVAVGETLCRIQKSVVPFADGKLTVCIQQSGAYAYAKILYGDFCALISFCDTNDFHGDCADVLVCTAVLPKNIHPADFALTVMSTDTPSAADFAAALSPMTVCTTAENGNISLCAEENGTFQITRRG